jgi:hypothetical protein
MQEHAPYPVHNCGFLIVPWIGDGSLPSAIN